MIQTYADAAVLADDHIAAIERQIAMFSTLPPNLTWHPAARQGVMISRKVIARAVTATTLYGRGERERARVLGLMQDDEIEELNTWNHQIAIALQFAAQDAGVLKLWERYRIAYAIDADLWAELGDSDDNTEIPAGILTRLPHPNPFVALPEPIVIPTHDEGLLQRLDGFFITGRFSVSEHGYLLTSTENSEGNLSLLLCSRMMRADGTHARNAAGKPDYSWVRVSFNDGQTVGELTERCKKGFQSAATGLDWENEVVLSLRRCTSILLYLCATNADLQVMSTPARRRGKNGQRLNRKHTRVVTVGWRLGAKLRAYKSRQLESASLEHPGSHRVRPHVRRAHFHTYRIGPGRPNARTNTEVKWVSAVPVNFEDNADVTTVIGVPRLGKELTT